jgi:hypothetical protein
MVDGYLGLVQLDLTSLYRERPHARRWGLQELTTRGRIRRLVDRGLTRPEINRFYRELDMPEIVVNPGVEHYYSLLPYANRNLFG